MTQDRQEALAVRVTAENGAQLAWDRYEGQVRKVAELTAQLEKAMNRRDALLKIAWEQSNFVKALIQSQKADGVEPFNATELAEAHR